MKRTHFKRFEPPYIGILRTFTNFGEGIAQRKNIDWAVQIFSDEAVSNQGGPTKGFLNILSEGN